jgi:hypothetical protein
MLKLSEHNDEKIEYVTNFQRHPTNLTSYPSVYDTSITQIETDEQMNQKFIKFLYSDRVRIRYLMHPCAHFIEEELKFGHYISVLEFNDCRRENDKDASIA